MHMGTCKQEKPSHDHTLAIRDEDGDEGGSPVGDLDGEIPLLVLEPVETDRLPLSIGAAGQRKAQQQRDRKRCSSSHCGAALPPADEMSLLVCAFQRAEEVWLLLIEHVVAYV